MLSIASSVYKKWLKEVQQVQQSDLEGIKVIADDEDLSKVEVYMLGPELTPFDHGCFKIKMQLTDTYPDTPPKCTFVTKTFHPNLHPQTGEICLNTLKKDWTRDTTIKQILITIRCLLIDPNPESALNEEAGKMLLEDYGEYCRRVKILCDVHCRSVLQEYNRLIQMSKKQGALQASDEQVTEQNAENTVPSTQSADQVSEQSVKKRAISGEDELVNSSGKAKSAVKKLDSKKRTTRRL
ncbi:hypothetical protein MP228_009923 [Amoeboaphelidium protococcarum]|nr:hypothetical protein MP228_009923 [Amoeboaphelidium protococcarum]